MSKGVALDRWMDANHFSNLMYLSLGGAERAAWKAGVKHAMGFVAEEYRRLGNEDVAEFVMKLEP